MGFCRIKKWFGFDFRFEDISCRWVMQLIWNLTLSATRMTVFLKWESVSRRELQRFSKGLQDVGKIFIYLEVNVIIIMIIIIEKTFLLSVISYHHITIQAKFQVCYDIYTQVIMVWVSADIVSSSRESMKLKGINSFFKQWKVTLSKEMKVYFIIIFLRFC